VQPLCTDRLWVRNAQYGVFQNVHILPKKTLVHSKSLKLFNSKSLKLFNLICSVLSAEHVEYKRRNKHKRTLLLKSAKQLGRLSSAPQDTHFNIPVLRFSPYSGVSGGHAG
jgi:hypothetical protein